MEYMEFSRNLKKVIFERSVSLKAISRATGIPTSTLSEWTAGRAPKISQALVKLCTYLGVSLDELMTPAQAHNAQQAHHAPAKTHKAAHAHIVLDGSQYLIHFEKLKSNK